MDLYTTIDAAFEALAMAERDVAGDMGEEAIDECYFDIVQSVAQFCTPDVARELRRCTIG